MTTHDTLNQARIYAKALSGARCIAEINHSTFGRCYIVVKVPVASLRSVLRSNPIPEIQSIIAEHSIYTPAEISAMRTEALRNSHCERCYASIDGNTAYHQREWSQGMQVTAFYCESCRTLLSAIGAGECTALQERASSRGCTEPQTKQD